MATVTALPLPTLGRILVTVEDQDGTCVQVERVINATGARAPLRPYVWVCPTSGEYLHLSDGKAYFWDTEAPLDTPFHYEATAVDATGAGIGAITSPLRGLLFPGTGGNATTPDNAALDVLGDIQLTADATLLNWSDAVNGVALVAKYTSPGNQRAYRLDTGPTVAAVAAGILTLAWSADGITPNTVSSTASVLSLVSDGGRLAVRVKFDVDNGAAGKTAIFETAPTLAGPWTQLGAAVTSGGTTSIFNSAANLEVGSSSAGAFDFARGVIHAVEVRNGIDGTVVANPDFYAQPVGTTSFTDQAGRVWTVNSPTYITGPRSAIVTSSSSLTLASNSGFWLRDPVRPCNDVRMELCTDDPECGLNGGIFVADMAPEGYQPNTNLQLPTNARRPIAINRQRRDTDSQLTVVAATFADRDALLTLNEPGSPLLLSAPAEYGVPDRYMSVGTETVTRGVPDMTFQPRLVSMPFTTVDRPVGPAQGVCGQRIDDICTTYATWAAAQAAGIDWGRLITGDPAALGLRTWDQVKTTWVTWNAVKVSNVDWADVKTLP